MTSFENIFNTVSWDTSITTKPSFFDLNITGKDTHKRAIFYQWIMNDDKIIGVIDRQDFSPDSYDGYRCIIVSETSEEDLNNMKKALKKIAATYTPTSAENIILWEGGSINIFNNKRWEIELIIMFKKAGISAF